MGRIGSGVGTYPYYVTLFRSPQTSNDSDGFYEALSPPGAWASITPQLGVDGRTQEHLIEMRFHPQVTMDTKIVYTDPDKMREFFVRGVQNLVFADTILRLICEEIVA
jgi:hypothetical protein